jgi:hypothetical protein
MQPGKDHAAREQFLARIAPRGFFVMCQRLAPTTLLFELTPAVEHIAQFELERGFDGAKSLLSGDGSREWNERKEKANASEQAKSERNPGFHRATSKRHKGVGVDILATVPSRTLV